MSELGYYRDLRGSQDTEDAPANRMGEKCLNCNQLWGEHFDWSCDTTRTVDSDYDSVPKPERYLTASMALTRGGLTGKYAYLYDPTTGQLLPDAKQEEKADKPTLSFTGPDLSDWRTWARVPHGHCACNVPKEQCPTHKRDR